MLLMIDDAQDWRMCCDSRKEWWIFYVMAQVEERLVGAVLGPAGRYVEEIKQYRSQRYNNKTPHGCFFSNLIFGRNLLLQRS